MTASEARFYSAGGTLRPDAPSYIERRADADLYDGLHRGEFCYVLTSRQMGKSSLMARTAARLRAEGVAVAVLDLAAIGQNLTVEQWYDGLLGQLGRHLDLEDEVEEYWLEHERQSPLQRWMGALREVVLPRLDDERRTTNDERRTTTDHRSMPDEPAGADAARTVPSALVVRRSSLVVFIDEIDAVRSLSFPTDEFFAAIRECYNLRTEEPPLNRLTFCLLGVASPSDLIQDPRTTPFNIGRRIELADFSGTEAAPLARGIADCGLRIADCEALLRRILYWTGGHPYLTQRLCQAVADSGAANPQSTGAPKAWGRAPGRNPQSVDRLCEELFLSPRAQERDSNLLFVREGLLRSAADLASLLYLYGQVRSGKRVSLDDTNPLVELLCLSGVVRVGDDRPPTTDHRPPMGGILRSGWSVVRRRSSAHLQVRNQIYERVFDTKWVAEHMPDAEVRRQRAAFRRGLARASVVASGIVTVMAVLAGTALGYAREAKAASDQAGRNEQRARWQAARAGKLNVDLQIALNAKESALRELEQSLKAADRERRRADQEADRAGTEANRANQEASAATDARGKAEDARNEAVRQTGIAEQKRTESLRRLVRLNLYTGQRSLDQEDPLGALPWFAEALRLQHGGRAQEEMHRSLLANVLRQAPQIDHLWTARKGVVPSGWSADLRRLVVVSEDGTAQVWDTTRDTALSAPLRHSSPIRSTAFSPDGRRLVTGCEDGTVWVWELATGKVVAGSMKHAGRVTQVEFSPDGRRVVTGSLDSTARVWDAASGAPVTPALKHADSVRCAVFSPDGRRVVTGASDYTARVWDAATGQPVTPPLGHNGWVNWVAFSPDGRRIAIGGWSGTQPGSTQVWEVATGQPVTPRLRHPLWIPYGAFSPDGRLLVTACWDGAARVWDAATGAPRTPPLQHGGPVRLASFSADGRQVATASEDRTARVWDAATGAPLTPPLQHSAPVSVAAFRADGRFLVTLDDNGTLREWDLARSPATAPTFRHDGRVSSASFSPDGRRVLTSSYDDFTAQVWDVATGEPLLPALAHRDGIARAAWSPDGRRIVTASWDGTGRVWDAGTGRPVGLPLRHATQVSWAAFSADGRRVVTVSQDETRVWDAATGRALTPLLQPGRLPVGGTFCAFSPDGRRVLTGRRDGTRLWDTASGRLLQRFDRQLLGAFSPDGKRLLTWGGATARVWDAVSCRPLGPLLTHSAAVSSAAFSPDGKRVVTGSNGIARVWDPETGRPRTPPMPHSLAGPVGVSFSSDGRRILTGGVPTDSGWGDASDTARVWDAATGEPVTPPFKHGSRLIRVAFSPDGRRVVAGGLDGTARVWDVSGAGQPLADLLQMAELEASRRIDATGGAATLTPDALRRAWETRPTKYRQDPRSSPAQALAWRRYSAAECERSRQWSLAIPHLAALIEARPRDATLRPRRADAYAALGRWDEAAADYAKAREPWPFTLKLPCAYARVQLARGDTDGYRRTCAALSDQLGETSDSTIEVANRLVRTCALAPEALHDLSPHVAIMERIVGSRPRYANVLQTLGFILYRAGRYEEAVQRLNEWTAARGPGAGPHDWLFLAMAHSHLGHTAEARQWLEKAAQRSSEQGGEAGVDGTAWQERLELRLLRREAETLLGVVKAPAMRERACAR